jgi:hypothetical protein
MAAQACRLADLSAFEVTDNQIAIGGLTEGANLRGATVPRVTDNQIAIGGLTEGTNLRGATVPRVTDDNQIAIGSLTEGTNLRVGRASQANRSHVYPPPLSRV